MYILLCTGCFHKICTSSIEMIIHLNSSIIDIVEVKDSSELFLSKNFTYRNPRHRTFPAIITLAKHDLNSFL